VNKDKGLVFYEASHRYKLDGEWVPGVTTIIGVIDKPGLINWAAREVAEYVADNPDGVEALRTLGRNPMVNALKAIPGSKRDAAANKGKEVHRFAEDIIHGKEVEVPEYLAGYVEAAIAFMEEYAIEPVLVERHVASREYQYGGTFDLIADSKKAPRAIYDYKTSRTGIYESTAWQNAAYAGAEFWVEDDLDGTSWERPLIVQGIQASFGVHLRPDSTYAVHPLEFGPHVFEEFLHIRAAYEANKRAVGNWRVPGSGYVGINEQSEASA
jgi:hypothetical protein